MAELVSIVYKPEGATPASDAFTRVPAPEARLEAGYGIVGDQKGGNVYRQLNVMGAESIRSLAPSGYKTAPGQLGEQLVISGFDIESLPEGTRLRIGDSAVIELLQLRDPCNRFESYQGRSMDGAVGKIGWMAAVVSSGAVRIGDPVAMVQPALVCRQNPQPPPTHDRKPIVNGVAFRT